MSDIPTEHNSENITTDFCDSPRSAAIIAEECQNDYFQPYQDVDGFYDAQQKKEADRAERRAAGYQSESVSESNSGSSEDESEQSDSGNSYHKSGDFFGQFVRPGKRNLIHSPVLASRVIPEIQRAVRKGQTRIVRESITVRGFSSTISEEMENIRRLLRKRGTVFAIAFHGEPIDHYHVVHACPWKWYCCRCYTLSAGTRRSLRTTALHTATESDWNNILQYLSTNGRLLQHLCSGSSYYERLRGIEFVPLEGLCNNGSEDQMEECNSQNESGSNSTGNADNPGNNGPSSQPNKKLAKPTSKARLEDLELMLMQHATVPLHSICASNVWQGSRFRFIDSSDPTMRKVISSIRKRICQWTINEFNTYYKDNPGVVWEAINKNFNDYYYDVDESLSIIYDLLNFQMYDFAAANALSPREMITNFVQEVYDVCEKRRPKVNTFEIIGPASSGKSYFVDMVTAFYLNVGHVKNFNKNESFPLQSCINRRILLWNEAQCETSQHDTIKLLLGGDPTPANIKYMDSQTINRTPVFITANIKLIPNTKPFNDRMIRYNWQTAPQLQKLQKKPHPLCFPELLSYLEVKMDH